MAHPLSDRFDQTIAGFDAIHADDPEEATLGGETGPRELLHARRATHWLEQLRPQASEALRLAIRAHHLRRWALPRASYPEGRAGYHAWRREQQRRHAAEARALLAGQGYEEALCERVAALIEKRREREPEARAEAQAFEDALCLVFVESELERFSNSHPRDKVREILIRTLPKMSVAARSLALDLALAPDSAALLREAVAGFEKQGASS